jgi:hypothetical protein
MVDSAKTCCVDGETTRMVVLGLHVMTLTVIQLCLLGTATGHEEQQTTRKYKYLDSKSKTTSMSFCGLW